MPLSSFHLTTVKQAGSWQYCVKNSSYKNRHFPIHFKTCNTSNIILMIYLRLFSSKPSSIFGRKLVSFLLRLVSVPSQLLSFYENFQSHQWDTKWKTSFEFQRPDRTHCLYRRSKGPLDKKVPSKLIIHAESPPGCCFLCQWGKQPKRFLESTGSHSQTW